MKYLISIFFVFLSAEVIAKENSLADFRKCYEERSNRIPEVEQKNFLDSYLKFIESKKAKDGSVATRNLILLSKKAGKKIPSTWISLFEGSMELCCPGKSSSCVTSFGSMSLSHLYPMIKKGNQAAANLVLAYSAVVDSDGADASGLREYQALIKPNKKIIQKFSASYGDLLKKYPVQWIDPE